MLNRRVLLLLLLTVCTVAQSDTPEQQERRSTDDLRFLLGEWNIHRVYRPGTENERDLFGSMSCTEAMNRAYIFCRYEMTRPDSAPAIDDVYFNYNGIYDKYESIWTSSTWPIKVLMSGTLEMGQGNWVLATDARFKIENDVTEYVRDNLSLMISTDSPKHFVRKTEIRTSNDADDEWLHHMTETATSMDSDTKGP